MNTLVWLSGCMVLIITTAAFYAKISRSSVPTQEEIVSSGTLDAYVQNLSATGSRLEKSPVYTK